MVEDFTTNELIMISLVCGQNRDEYDDEEIRRDISQLGSKARRLANVRTGDDQ